MFSRSWSTVGHFVPLCAKRLDCELFFCKIVHLECLRQGEWRAGWHRYIFALPNDTNTISWLSEQIESHSLFVSLTLCPCLSVSPSCTHFTLSSHRHITCAFICYRTLMCYTHPGGCCLIAFGSAVCQCWTWNLSVYPFSSHRGRCVS